jgi:hypothetical protein
VSAGYLLRTESAADSALAAHYREDPGLLEKHHRQPPPRPTRAGTPSGGPWGAGRFARRRARAGLTRRGGGSLRAKELITCRDIKLLAILADGHNGPEARGAVPAPRPLPVQPRLHALERQRSWTSPPPPCGVHAAMAQGAGLQAGTAVAGAPGSSHHADRGRRQRPCQLEALRRGPALPAKLSSPGPIGTRTHDPVARRSTRASCRTSERPLW